MANNMHPVTLDDVAAKIISDVAELARQIEFLKARVSFLEEKVEQLASRVDSIEKQRLEELKKLVYSIEEDLDRVSYDLHLALGPR